MESLFSYFLLPALQAKFTCTCALYLVMKEGTMITMFPKDGKTRLDDIPI